MKTQIREKRWVAATSVGAAVILTATKLGVGVLTGSLGILAEAAHSALDLAAAVITFFAVRVSDRPADASHHYGHGKVENLSALFETLLLLITCIWIIYEAIHRLFFKTVEVDPSLWAFLIMGLSIVVDFSRSRALARVAKKYNSQALEADALHFSTDIWSSAVVILGLVLVKIGDYRGGDKTLFEDADAIAALVVAVIVICVSYRLGRRAIDALLDHAPSGLADRVSRSVGQVAGIQHVSQTRVRDAGGQVFVDLKIDVPRHLSFEETYQLTQEAQKAVHSISPNADVIVRAVPIQDGEGLLEKIHAVAVQEHVSIHNVTTHWTDRGLWIDLDLEVDPHVSFESAHESATRLESNLRDELMKMDARMRLADISVHIEPRNDESNRGMPLDPLKADAYIQRVKEICRELEGIDESHQIELHEINGSIYLSCHLLVHADIPIADVHRLAEETESRLRHEFPELGRVVIHTEPS
jgi:cation diffusion facilitator family transporter